MSKFRKNEHFLLRDTHTYVWESRGKFVFRKIWHALLSCYLRFKIHSFALLPPNYASKVNFQSNNKFLIHNLAFKKYIWHLPSIIFEVRMSLGFKFAKILRSRSLFIFRWNPVYHDRGQRNNTSYPRLARRDCDWKFIYARKLLYAITQIMAEIDLKTISELQLITR